VQCDLLQNAGPRYVARFFYTYWGKRGDFAKFLLFLRIIFIRDFYCQIFHNKKYRQKTQKNRKNERFPKNGTKSSDIVKKVAPQSSA
jgi:hypothetical protein